MAPSMHNTNQISISDVKGLDAELSKIQIDNRHNLANLEQKMLLLVDEHAESISNQDAKLDRILDSLQTLRDDFKDVKTQITNLDKEVTKLTTSVMDVQKNISDPKEGIIVDVEDLKKFKMNVVKILWIILTSSLGLWLKMIFDFMTSYKQNGG